MKFLLSLTLLLSIFFLFNSCGDDTVINNNGGNPTADFDIYLGKISQQPLRYSSYTIKSDGTGLKLFNDSMAVGASSGNNKILLAKIDSTGSSFKVYSANYDGTNMKYIPADSYYPVYFDLSPDGTKALFTTDAGNYMFIINTDGTGLLQLSDGIRGTEFIPKFSPDSKLIAYFEAPASLETGLFITNTTGTYKKQLTDSIFYTNSFTLDWSPDGSKIVYQSRKGNLNEPVIYIIDTSGNNLEILTGGFNPLWSPNGTKISFLGFGMSNQNDLYLMNPDGTGIVNITNSSGIYEGNGRWSADGTKLLFSQQYLNSISLSYYIYNLNLNTSSFLIDSVNGAIWK